MAPVNYTITQFETLQNHVNMDSKFSIRNLSLRLGSDQLVLNKVSLEIPSGQVTSLIGPSGSGKSSLLRCLNRLSDLLFVLARLENARAGRGDVEWEGARG